MFVALVMRDLAGGVRRLDAACGPARLSPARGAQPVPGTLACTGRSPAAARPLSWAGDAEASGGHRRGLDGRRRSWLDTGWGQVRCVSLCVGRGVCQRPGQTTSPSGVRSWVLAGRSPATAGDRRRAAGGGDGRSGRVGSAARPVAVGSSVSAGRWRAGRVPAIGCIVGTHAAEPSSPALRVASRVLSDQGLTARARAPVAALSVTRSAPASGARRTR